tara:strand:+ start:4505 stop:5500 length:996 start_codon:yes stop_codon:yes gene_type:complete
MISIIMPVYNSAPFIGEAIDSILNQTYKDIELIIINDGSTDNSASIIESYNDNRIKLINNDSNKGIVYSLNKSISMSSGQYIARMDSDDIANIDRLESQLKYLNLHNLDICGSSINTFGLMRRIINYPETTQDVKFFSIFGSPVAHPTAFGYAQLFKKYPYRNVTAEDYDLWTRMLMDGVNIGNIQVPLLDYRIHEGQLTEDKTDIIKSSMSISKSYIKEYVQNNTTRGILESCDCFMGESLDLKEITEAAKNLSNFAKENKVSKSMHSRALFIIFSRSKSFNLFTFFSYMSAIRNSGEGLIGSINIKLSLLMIFSIKKNSNFIAFLKRYF